MTVIGLILVVYAVARLLQVPLETITTPKREIALWLISLPAILALGVLALVALTLK
jgi:hypothetical protein